MSSPNSPQTCSEPPGWEQRDRLSDAQIGQLCALYRNEWWSAGRKEDDVRRMLAHTDLFIALVDPATENLLAFARVLTDRVYKALIFDVIVRPEHRKTQLGRALMDAILNHPALADVGHFDLYCRPALVPFYEKWGFTKDLGELRAMRLVRKR